MSDNYSSLGRPRRPFLLLVRNTPPPGAEAGFSRPGVEALVRGLISVSVRHEMTSKFFVCERVLNSPCRGDQPLHVHLGETESFGRKRTWFFDRMHT